jgi:pimeloyl-ACP methyl ester carboxylesterase
MLGSLRAIWTFAASIRDLELPADIGDESPDDKVEPMAVMPDLHLLPGIWTANIGYGDLLDWLRARFRFIEPSTTDPSRLANLLPVAYDWRLSNRYNGRRLKQIVEPALERWRSQGAPYSEAKVIFICHSMGGLVARWYIEKEGGAELTRKLVTLGTPYRGALEALEQLVNGVRKGIGPIKVDFSALALSLPSMYQLLPEYACIESSRGLLKTTEVAVPTLNADMVADAMKFHDEMDNAATLNKTYAYDVHPIVGFRQRTHTTARITSESIEAIETIKGKDEGGDGTVPRLSANPKKERPDSPIIRPIPDQHCSLQSNQAVLDEIESVLTANPLIHRGVFDYEIGVRTESIVLAGEPVVVEATVGLANPPVVEEATVANEKGVALLARVYDEQGTEVAKAPLWMSGGLHSASMRPLPAGAYRLVVGAVDPVSAKVAPVTSTVLVWESNVQ